MNTTKSASPFPWFGGKQHLAPKIAALLPPHKIYVEAFGGGASVLFAKSPSKVEVYNDVDDGLVTFFRALRDRPRDLCRAITLSPYARAEFELCRETWRDVEDDVERARRWYVTIAQAFGASQKWSSWGFEVAGRANRGRSKTYATRSAALEQFAERFRGVQVDHLDWRACLDRYDGPEACFYLDPPYVLDTRSGRRYENELADDDHRELVERALALEGAVLLSGYASDLYRPLEDAGFERIEWDVNCRAHNSTANGKATPRTEVLWRRDPGGHGRLFADAQAAAA